MSHNITKTNVKITDLDMFGQCVADLSNGRAVLDKDAKNFRTYPGQPTGCDAAVKMPGPHDIGLKKGVDGSYTTVFDPYGMDRVFQKAGGHAIGGLLQEYALREAEYQAAQQGMSSTRVEGPKGLVTLELVPAS